MFIDFGKTADDYARHRVGFPTALFDRLARFEVGLPGQRILDLGTGTGALARGFARRGAVVTGLDPSAALTAKAAACDRAEGLAIRYVTATAEESGLPDAGFDVVSAGQCWHWFDRPRAAAEVRRLLVPGGHVVIAHFDWLPLAGSVVEATEALIVAHNPGWGAGGHIGMYPQWLPDLQDAGFTELETFSFDVAVPYTHVDWRGRIRASAGVAASLPPDDVARFDEAHAAMLASHFPADPLAVPHRVFAIVGQRPATS